MKKITIWTKKKSGGKEGPSRKGRKGRHPWKSLWVSAKRNFQAVVVDKTENETNGGEP